ncbi:MAG: hypothetical protein KIH63_005525, partial [Candidatus Saccharibacteria bacterium]|nr:hypothetical protein [Candidatus Saccharibacteria bacterium]
MSAGEQVDILNERGEVVGTMSREQAEEENHATPNVLIFLFNSLGQTWKQLRPMSKNHYPGRWDITACGGVVNGQDD